MNSGFKVLDLSLSQWNFGFWIPMVSGTLDSLSCIADSTSKGFPASFGIPYIGPSVTVLFCWWLSFILAKACNEAQVFPAQTVPKLARFRYLDESAKKLERYQTLIRSQPRPQGKALGTRLIRSKTCTLCRSKACTIPRLPWKRKADPWKLMSVHQKFVQTRALKVLTKGDLTCFPYLPLLSSKEKALKTRLRLTVTFGHFNKLSLATKSVLAS